LRFGSILKLQDGGSWRVLQNWFVRTWKHNRLALCDKFKFRHL